MTGARQAGHCLASDWGDFGLEGSGSNGKRATVHDVARQAGVSLATVDRVLNGRPGVRAQTAEKVDAAIRALDFRRDLSASLLARARDLSVAFLLPEGSNEFMQSLTAAIGRRARTARPSAWRSKPSPTARSMPKRLPRGSMPSIPAPTTTRSSSRPRMPPVRAAIDRAARRGIAVMTLVSDLPGSARRRFIGIDNAAAGRTAASLMGRFLPSGGKVGLIAGSLALRDHRERLEGFPR